MIGFCSWSGGKDSALSLYRAKEDLDLEVKYIVNMINKDRHIGHGTPPQLIKKQAESLQIELVQREVLWETYEENYSQIIDTLDVGYGVYGDIDIEEHREWVLKFSKKHGIEPILPLWNENPHNLYQEFIDMFKAIIVKVDPEKVGEEWLGKPLTQEFHNYLKKQDIHPMGEHGEYHTFVVDGPIFQQEIDVSLGIKNRDKETGNISINIK
ncbi:diphthine--ammonia ligase [Methanonatronarchaeum sp. AMET-Sl]|uniref:Dph6-related ATP pyrophosphatase n=1 Tax=Methanonatronarchaeum sp. AMET-Sl TaxID=3037654 RepID=UPI00244E1A33|nr:diphthine--ammonia ligase [Methanonatronarchaeum sp. AMET-Sl]WGI17586.1 diphthine--ammonia ligase [Methanonatronarchaeum sp. AMET-Sl]